MAKNLFSTDKLRWFFAETLVIVLGILIALGLDDYRTDLYERRLAIEYVQRIQDELEQDLGYIANIWVPRLRIKRESLEFIAPVIRGQSPVPSDIVEFLKHVSRGGMLGTSAAVWYTDTAFQDMRATGNLRLVQDAAIRAAISDYYETLESETLRVERRFTNYIPFVVSVMPAELRDDIDSDSLELFGVDYALKRLLTDEFRNELNREYNLMLFMERMRYQEYAQALYEVLETYRTRLERE